MFSIGEAVPQVLCSVLGTSLENYTEVLKHIQSNKALEESREHVLSEMAERAIRLFSLKNKRGASFLSSTP